MYPAMQTSEMAHQALAARLRLNAGQQREAGRWPRRGTLAGQGKGSPISVTPLPSAGTTLERTLVIIMFVALS